MRVLRILARWRQLQEDDDFPSISCVDSEEIEDTWPYWLALDFLG